MGRQARLKRERRLERESRVREKEARAQEGMARGCLVCRGRDGGFTTEEHAIPESMGNAEIVLPNGVTCDACNNGVLSDLDQALCEFFPLKMRRTLLGIESKAGKVPHTRFQTGSVSHRGIGPNGEPSLFFEINSARDRKTFYEAGREGDRVKLKFNASGGRRLTPRYCSVIARALLKSALECAWLDHGEMMLEARFDHVRDAIRGVPWTGFFLMGRSVDPEDTSATLTYNFATDGEGRDRIWVWVSYFGIQMGTDSRLSRPLMPAPDEAALLVAFGPGNVEAAA